MKHQKDRCEEIATKTSNDLRRHEKKNRQQDRKRKAKVQQQVDTYCQLLLAASKSTMQLEELKNLYAKDKYHWKSLHEQLKDEKMELQSNLRLVTTKYTGDKYEWESSMKKLTGDFMNEKHNWEVSMETLRTGHLRAKQAWESSTQTCNEKHSKEKREWESLMNDLVEQTSSKAHDDLLRLEERHTKYKSKMKAKVQQQEDTYCALLLAASQSSMQLEELKNLYAKDKYQWESLQEKLNNEKDELQSDLDLVMSKYTEDKCEWESSMKKLTGGNFLKEKISWEISMETLKTGHLSVKQAWDSFMQTCSDQHSKEKREWELEKTSSKTHDNLQQIQGKQTIHESKVKAHSQQQDTYCELLLAASESIMQLEKLKNLYTKDKHQWKSLNEKLSDEKEELQSDLDLVKAKYSEDKCKWESSLEKATGDSAVLMTSTSYQKDSLGEITSKADNDLQQQKVEHLAETGEWEDSATQTTSKTNDDSHKLKRKYKKFECKMKAKFQQQGDIYCELLLAASGSSMQLEEVKNLYMKDKYQWEILNEKLQNEKVQLQLDLDWVRTKYTEEKLAWTSSIEKLTGDFMKEKLNWENSEKSFRDVQLRTKQAWESSMQACKDEHVQEKREWELSAVQSINDERDRFEEATSKAKDDFQQLEEKYRRYECKMKAKVEKLEATYCELLLAACESSMQLEELKNSCKKDKYQWESLQEMLQNENDKMGIDSNVAKTECAENKCGWGASINKLTSDSMKGRLDWKVSMGALEDGRTCAKQALESSIKACEDKHLKEKREWDSSMKSMKVQRDMFEQTASKASNDLKQLQEKYRKYVRKMKRKSQQVDIYGELLYAASESSTELEGLKNLYVKDKYRWKSRHEKIQNEKKGLQLQLDLVKAKQESDWQSSEDKLAGNCMKEKFNGEVCTEALADGQLRAKQGWESSMQACREQTIPKTHYDLHKLEEKYRNCKCKSKAKVRQQADTYCELLLAASKSSAKLEKLNNSFMQGKYQWESLHDRLQSEKEELRLDLDLMKTKHIEDKCEWNFSMEKRQDDYEKLNIAHLQEKQMWETSMEVVNSHKDSYAQAASKANERLQQLEEEFSRNNLEYERKIEANNQRGDAYCELLMAASESNAQLQELKDQHTKEKCLWKLYQERLKNEYEQENDKLKCALDTLKAQYTSDKCKWESSMETLRIDHEKGKSNFMDHIRKPSDG